MPATITHTRPGYRASKSEGEFRIHRVPIFVECTRGDFTADAEWVRKAISHAMLQQRDHYFPPLHCIHHGDGDVVHAGWFEITHAAPITLKARRITAIFADLVITNPDVEQLMRAKRLPYRSVEIFDVDGEPAIDTVALLDHEPPFHELPMLFVNDVDEQPGGTFKTAWTMKHGCFTKIRRRCFSKEQITMTTPDNTPNEKTQEQFGEGVVPPDAAKFAEDEKPDKKDDGDGEDMQGADVDVGAVCKAIESGEISVNDMDAILAAIQARNTDSELKPEEEEPAPAAVPGGEAMKKDSDLAAQFAAVSGENAALKARLDERDAADIRKADVADAMKRLEGRPMGDLTKLEADLNAFHKEGGAKLFKVHVDSMVKTAAVMHGEDPTADTFAGQKGAPDVAMKYQDKGTDAVDQAARFCAEWSELKQRGMPISQTQERYVEINMARLAAQEVNRG